MLSKKVNKNGSITLPKQLRTEAGIISGNAVDIEHRGEEIVIRKHAQTCHFCGKAENVKNVNIKNVRGIDICRDCAAQIHKVVACDD